MTLIFDGHTDVFTGVLQRRLNGERDVLAQEFLPKLRCGGVEGGCFVFWADPPYDKEPAARIAQMMQAASEELAECADAVLVHSLAEIEAAKAAGKFYILAGAEGLSAIGDSLEKLDRFYDFGVRHAMLTWNEENLLASGAKGNPEHGLTAFGRQVVQRMEEKRMIVDVSHLNDRSFWDVMDVVTKPVIASHSNARALAAVPRNLADDQLRAIAESGGFVGLNAFNEFVSTDPAQQNMDGFVRQAAYIAETIGVEHMAFGFDFSGFISEAAMRSFSSQDSPATEGLEDWTKLPDFLDKLRSAGFSADDLKKIAHGNWLRVIGEILG